MMEVGLIGGAASPIPTGISIQATGMVAMVDKACEALDRAGGNFESDTIKKEVEDAEKIGAKSIADDLDHTKEHFEKLKDNFIVLQTKHGFMSKLANFDPAAESEKKQKGETEEKAALKAIKQENVALREQLGQLSEVVADSYQRVKAASEGPLMEDLEGVEALEREENALRATIDAQKVQLEALGGRTAMAVQEATAAAIAELKSEEDAMALTEEELIMLEAEVAAAEAQADRVDAELVATNSQYSELVAAETSLNAKYEEQAAWYADAAGVMGSLAGTAIRSITAAAIEVELDVAGAKHLLAIPYKGELAQSVLSPGASLDGSIDAIRELAADACAKNDIALLVRSVCASLATKA